MERIKIISEAIRKGGVLATIVQVDGSAYRKEGTMMLFTKDGQQMGMVSASCLEVDLEIQVERLLDRPHHFSQLIVYDMSREDDLGWGKGAGCNGKVHILLEKVDESLKKSFKKVLKHVTNNMPVMVYKSLHTVPGKVSTSYYPQNDVPFGTNIDTISTKDTYANCLYPQQRLIIFGAGQDVMPLIRFAHDTGFETYLWSANVSETEQFQPAICFRDLKALVYYPSDYVVVMTHDFQQDKKVIQQVLFHQTFRYVGVLGPRKRMERLLHHKEIPSWIHNPVGLDIRAEGPEEIAISIMAEIIKVKNEVQYRVQESNRDLFSSGKEYKI